MDECWRCASKLIAGSRFCPGCGAAIGSSSGASTAGVAASKPIEREPADPLAATAPADAAHLAALRRGNLAPPKKESDAPRKTKGRTVPMKASDLQAGKALMASVQHAPPASPAQPTPAPRRVAKTQADEPTLPSHGEPPRTSPKASSTFGDPVPPPKQPQAFQAYVPPAQPPAPMYPAQPPAPMYAAPAAPAAPAIGSKVMVEWADGNRYPATVQQCAPGQCLVLFPDGQQRWVDMRRVTSA